MSLLPQWLVNSLVTAAILASFGIGVSIYYKTCRFLNFAHVVPFVLCPYLTISLVEHLDVPILLAVIAACGVSAMAAVALELGVYERLRARGTRSTVLMLVSFAVIVICENLVALIWGVQPRQLASEQVAEGILLAGARITHVQVESLLLAVFSLVGCKLILNVTKLGLCLKAIGSDDELAYVCGIDQRAARVKMVIVTAIPAGIAGVLVGYDTVLTPSMGMPILFFAVVAVVIGGAGSLQGLIVGAFLVAATEQGGIAVLGGRWYDLAIFATLLLCLLLRPNGLFTKPLR